MTDKTATADIPETTASVSSTPATVRDPSTGLEVSVHLGATPHPDDDAPIVGDRGDDPNAPSPASLSDDVTEVEVTEEPAVEAAEPAERARGEDGKFVKAKDEVTEDAVTQEEGDEVETRSRTVPRERFDQVNEKRKAAERRLAELDAEQSTRTAAKEDAYDFDANEQVHMELVLDGKFKEAIAKRKEIDAAKEEVWLAKAAQVSLKAVDHRTSVDTVESLIEDATGRYEAFDIESDNFNEEATADVDSLMSGYMTRKNDPMDPATALRTAIEKVVKLHGLKDLTAPATPTAEVKAEKKGPPRMNVQKKVDLAKQQPPSTAAAGTTSQVPEAPDLSRMSDAEIDALPAATYARLRGDVL